MTTRYVYTIYLSIVFDDGLSNDFLFFYFFFFFILLSSSRKEENLKNFSNPLSSAKRLDQNSTTIPLSLSQRQPVPLPKTLLNLNLSPSLMMPILLNRSSLLKVFWVQFEHMESLTLPPAAKTQKETASNTKSYGALQESSSKPSQDVSPNDRSPLLEVHPQQKISDRLDRKGSTASFSSSIRNNLDFKCIVHRISSVNSNTKKNNRALSDVAMDLMISAEQVDFTAWLDEQFKKIDSFYKEKEKRLSSAI